MNPKNPLRLAALCALAISMVISCKKKVQESPASPTSASVNRKPKVIRDSAVDISAYSTYRFTTFYTLDYNTDTTLKHIGFVKTTYFTPVQIVSSGTSFTYETGKVVRTDTLSSSVDTLRLDSLGRLRTADGNIFDYYPNSGRIWHNSPSGGTYLWNTDDLTDANYSVDTFHFDYYTDKTTRFGDGIQLNELLRYGQILTKNKHLIKATSKKNSHANTEQYSYIFDEYDRITHMTYTSAYGTPPDTTTAIHNYTFEY